ncbi:MAG: zinc-binding dehydrogenase [Burkholderiales bacterium]|nr:zinc-binding dehydrogenase [Burkholderiales bacterium]
MQAARIHRHGGADVITIDDVPTPEAGEAVIVDVAYAGANYVDVYQREGRYPGIQLPLTLGIEAAGRVRHALSASRFRAGDRVAFAALAQGGYAEQIAVPDHALVRVPDSVPLQEAAAVLEQGLTAEVLIHDVARIAPGYEGWALVHAAGGGVGRWLVNGLVRQGIKVIALASTPAKRQQLTAWGAAAVSSLDDDWPAQARHIAEGQGIRWVFDSVGKATFDGSLASLDTCGHLVLFGAASGPVVPVDPARLMARSATLSRPVLPHYLSNPARLAQRAEGVFNMARCFPQLAEVGACFPLNAASEAHQALESRDRQGKVLLSIGGEA